MKTGTVIKNITLNNRDFILSQEVRPCGRIGFYAHELGELTQWAKVFNTGERKAHRINKSMRVKGMKYISKPFDSESEAMAAIKERSEMNVQYF
jgi:hypothetical protein